MHPLPKLLLALNASLFLGAPAGGAADFRYAPTPLVTLEQAELAPSGKTATLLAEPGQPLVLEGEGSFATPPLAIEPGAEYLFRARIRSADSVVVRLGNFSMAYNDLGQWQTVTGLYRATDPARAVINIALRSLRPGETARAEVESLSLVRVERPTTIARKARSGATELVREGKAHATLVIPANAPAYAKLAERIAHAVKEATGVELPVVNDREATEAEFPILKPEYRRRNLLLLGRLGNNRAFWPAYNRFLTAVDGFYPGGNGYALHTAANVFHSGENHLIIGGTSDTGVERGVAAFLKIVTEAKAEGGTLRIPWLLECDLQGDCLALVKADDARWKETPENPLLPKPEPGYGNVVRWYANAMGYYWSGWESYRQRADHYLAEVLRERAYTHHYIMEFFVRTFDMLDESSCLSPEQVAAVDAQFLHNFLNIITVDDASWMTLFAPPYGQIGIVNRHQIAPWMGDYQFARFIDETLSPEGGLADLVHFRRMEKERAFEDFLENRNNPSLPGGVLNEVYAEVNSTFFRFALEGDRYTPFFSNGNATKALALERTNHLNGMLTYPSGTRDLRLPLGILTSLTGDPEMHWLWANLPEHTHVRGYFQNRYLGQIRRYTPDASLPQAVPTKGLGIQFTPNPVANASLKATPENYYFVAIREGFEPKDDYLAFNGVQGVAPSGAVVSLLSDGVAWLGSGDKGGRFEANTATVARTDAPQAAMRRTDTSRGVWHGELPTGEALRFQQPLSNEIEWTRDAIRLGHGRFVFRDRFTAKTAGTYLLGVGWHPTGSGAPVANEEGAYRFQTRSGKLEARLLGEGFSTLLDAGALRGQALRTLGRGESATLYSVFQSSPSNKAAPLPVVQEGAQRLRLGSGPQATVLAWDLSANEGAPYTAGLAIHNPQQTGLYNAVAAGKSGPRQNLALSSEASAGLARALAVAAPQPAPAPQAEGLQATVQDRTAQWQEAWRYGGMLKPALVHAKLANGVADLGEVVDLAEIRAQSTTPYFEPGKLPETLALSADGSEWRPASGSRQWRPGLRTGNYGEAHPEPHTDETFFPENGKAVRYIQTGGAALQYFTRSRLAARHPLRIETGDLLGNGSTQALVVSDVFPQFPRALREDDLSIALLDEAGKPLFAKDLAGPVQSIRVLERKRGGGKELFVLYGNGTLEIRSLADGEVRQKVDFYAYHQDFAAPFRERATRQPPGGFVLPFGIGLWRPNAEGESRVVISRYGGFTFLKPDLSFEGVLNSSGYATPGVLAHGADFGSGQEEQVIAERLRIWQLGGEGTPSVRPPGDPQFWKQTYHLLKSIQEDETSSAPLGGHPILRFERLDALAGKPRYILLARSSSICLYDASSKTFAQEWDAQAPLKGVAILEQGPGRLRLLAASANSLLWELEWVNGVTTAPTQRARQLPFPVTSMHDGGNGTALLAGPQGLYRMTATGELEQLAKGAWQAAAPATAGTIVAATAQGEVVQFTGR